MVINLNFAVATEISNLSTIKEEELLGLIFRRNLISSGITHHSLLVQSYINRLGSSLVKLDAKQSPQRFHFLVIALPEINGFAFMGKNIGIYSGLINITQNESELAAVLAHEIGHIKQQHFSRALLEQQKLLPITIIETLAATAMGIPNLILPIVGLHMQQMLNFSRAHEKEADHVAIDLLNRSNFDPMAMVTMFERMEQLNHGEQQIPEYFLTHPIFSSRILEARQRSYFKSGKVYQNSIDYQLIKEITALGITKNKVDSLSEINHLLELSTVQSKVVLKFKKAILLKELYRYVEARQILNQLLEQDPENIILQLNLIEILLQQDPGLAKQSLQALYDLDPQNVAIAIMYAQALIQLNLIDPAMKILQPLDHDNILQLIEVPKLYELLISGYQKLNLKAQACLSQAKLMAIKNQFTACEQKIDLAIQATANQPDPLISRKSQDFKQQLKQLTNSLKLIKGINYYVPYHNHQIQTEHSKME